MAGRCGMATSSGTDADLHHCASPARARLQTSPTLPPRHSRSESQEILQQLLSFEREDAFGVELHSVNRKFAMAQAHDLLFLRPCRDFEASGKRLPFHQQRVVARGLKGRGESGEDAR